MSYLSFSSKKDFKFEECHTDMSDRRSPDQVDISAYNPYTHEYKAFERRFKVISSNNRAYRIASDRKPSVEDLEMFSYIDASFSLLWPLKKYLVDHPELAVKFKGFVPFGREVKKFYNAVAPDEWKINGSPSYKDHKRLQTITNRKALLTGISSVTINTWMYKQGLIL